MVLPPMRHRQTDGPVGDALADRRVGGAREEDVDPGLSRDVVRGDAQAAPLVLLEVEIPEERVRVDRARAVIGADLEGALGDDRELRAPGRVTPRQRPDREGGQGGDLERHGGARGYQRLYAGVPPWHAAAKKVRRRVSPPSALRSLEPRPRRFPRSARRAAPRPRWTASGWSLRDARGSIVVVYDAERGTAEIAAPKGDLVLSAPHGQDCPQGARGGVRGRAVSSSAPTASSSARATSTATSRASSRRGPSACARWRRGRTSSSRSA